MKVICTLAILCFISLTSYAGTSTGLLGWWKFEEGAGTSVADSSGNSNTGTLTNGPTWGTSCIRGSCVVLDGSNDYVDAGAFNSIEGSSGLTIAFWAKQSTYHQAAYVSKNANNGFMIQPWDDQKIYFAVNDITNRAITAAGVYPLNTWYQVVGTYDGSTLRIYVNGVSKASSSKSTTVPTDALNLFIGFNGTTAYFNGRMDDVRIYNRALSAAEIRKLYIDNDVVSFSGD